MTFYFGSGSGSMHLTNESDPDPDPTIFVIDLQEAYKKHIFSAYYFFEGTFTSFFKEKMKCCGSGSDDLDPLDLYAFESPGSGFISQRYGSGSFSRQAKIVRTFWYGSGSADSFTKQ
jgi:hypothetical protein